MNQFEIENYCRYFLKEHYGIDLSIPVNANSRLTRTLGKFVFNSETHEAARLEFSKKFMLSEKPSGDKIKVIKHECIHYALFLTGKPYNDGDPYFEGELVKHDSISTNSISFRTERNIRVYECHCREHLYSQTISAKRCTRCNQRLTYKDSRKMLV